MRGARLVVVGCLAAILTACNFAIPGTEPLPTYFVIPTLTPAPSAPEGQPEEGSEAVGVGGEIVEGGAVVGDEDLPLVFQGTEVNTDLLDSYETAFTMSQTTTEPGGASESFSYVVTQSFSRDPLASRVVINAEGTDPSLSGQAGTFELIQMGDTAYFITAQPGQPAECLSFSSTEDAPFAGAIYSPDAFLAGGDFSGAQRILPDENVNGVLARHYRITEAIAQLGYPGLNSYLVDIYVATLEGNDIVVRETFSANGDVEGSMVQVEWTYDLLNINGPVNIAQPEGCAPPAGADFPTMPDATDVTSFGGVVSYTTASSIADVQAFYTQQLPAQGWTPGAVSEQAGFVTMEFTRGEETASINITEGSVIVTLTP